MPPKRRRKPPKQPRPGRSRRLALAKPPAVPLDDLPPLLCEASLFGQGGYEFGNRFIVDGLIVAGIDVELRPFWSNVDIREVDD